jgi:UDP-N-acetylglucosamine:LPS N-acetylglucosamine transferase
MADRGAAILCKQSELDAAKLSEHLAKLMDDPAALERMRSDMNALGRPDAADRIVDWLIDVQKS